MSYLVLARKYRPLDFTSVSGQEHVTRTLSNAIKRGKVSHAYLFAGPRGVGKTSIARIFSKALNCEQGPTDKPCLKCTNCQEIAQGISLAVREIDGASHNSVENVRELIDSFRALPAPGSRYKIYIIDEVHMLSSAAFNALLKSLEEPPPHTVFILATTEPHKIPETVLSRCQRHDLRALEGQEIERRIRFVAATEKIQIDDEAIRMLSRYADGSMRDAQSILDRVLAFCDGPVTGADVGTMLGSVERRVLYRLSQAIFKHAADEVLEVIAEAFSGGIDVGLFLREFVVYFRELLVAKFGAPGSLEKFGLSADDIVEMQRQVAPLSASDLQDLVGLAREGADSALRSAYPKYALEALLVRMALRENVRDLAEIVAGLQAEGSASSPVKATPAGAAPPRRSASPESGGKSTASAAGGARPAVGATGAAPLVWADFVRAAVDSGNRMLSEQLKRLAPIQFQAGLLQAAGPDFTVKYLAGKENKAKLEECLALFTGAKSWRIELSRADAGANPSPPGSLAYEEEAQRERETQQTEQSVADHPKFRSLQKVFPGSKIENIITKE